MKYNKYHITGENIENIINILVRHLIDRTGWPSIEEKSETGNTFFYVFERYSLLQNSDMSGILFIDIIGEKECIITSVVAGGKQGIFRLDIFNREGSYLEDIDETLEEICSNFGWQINKYAETDK